MAQQGHRPPKAPARGLPASPQHEKNAAIAELAKATTVFVEALTELVDMVHEELKSQLEEEGRHAK